MAKKLVSEKGKTKRITATKRKTEQQVGLRQDAPISNHFNNYNLVCSCTRNIYYLSAHPMRRIGRTVAVVHCTDCKPPWKKRCDAKMTLYLSKQLQCDLLTIFACILTLRQHCPWHFNADITHFNWTDTHTKSHICEHLGSFYWCGFTVFWTIVNNIVV